MIVSNAALARKIKALKKKCGKPFRVVFVALRQLLEVEESKKSHRTGFRYFLADLKNTFLISSMIKERLDVVKDKFGAGMRLRFLFFTRRLHQKALNSFMTGDSLSIIAMNYFRLSALRAE